LSVRDLVVRTRLQALDGLRIVAVALPFATLETFDPDGVQPTATKEIVVDSGLSPVFVSRGENASAPVILVHVTPPVAVVRGAALEPELQPVADRASRARAMQDAHHDFSVTDTALSLGPPRLAPQGVWPKTVAGFKPSGPGPADRCAAPAVHFSRQR
jgi:hypothetical protein